MRKKDSTSAITALKYAVSLDATFSRAWIELGWTYAASRDKDSALNAFQKAIEADPKQLFAYKILAFMDMDLGNQTMRLPRGKNCKASLLMIMTSRSTSVVFT